MKRTVLYIHGKGGTPQEAEHYKPLFKDCNVIGFDYKSETPTEAKTEFCRFIDSICKHGERVILIANSIGAYFSMLSFNKRQVEKAFFISPIVDMEKLIVNMMSAACVTEETLKNNGEIHTEFGVTLSWDYLKYVRENPVEWDVPTYILYGETDNLTSFELISDFSSKIGASLTVMKNGEHWFHTEEQMKYLDRWIINSLNTIGNRKGKSNE